MTETIKREKVNDTVKMSLLTEVQGKCPICRKPLITRKKNSNTSVRVFDIAHIYPLNATDDEVELLKNEEKLSEDIDSEGNFIALCKTCHKIYDTKKTVKEYRKLVEIKKYINKLRQIEDTWDSQTLHKDMLKVAERISNLSNIEIERSQLNYKALTIGEKTDESFGSLNERKVNQLVIDYYQPIKESLKLLELQQKAQSQFICSQVRTYYLLLEMKELSQSQIFERMCEWFMVNTGIDQSVKAEILVSYFIQNCEVFSEC